LLPTLSGLPLRICYSKSIDKKFCRRMARPVPVAPFLLAETFLGSLFGRIRVRKMKRKMKKMRRAKFATFKERGEWVELKFMAAAVERGLRVLKPWGDSRAYDVGLDHKSKLVRVQVKSTTCRTQYGYLWKFKPSPSSRHQYTLGQLDFFAAYVIPENVWYLIPAAILLRSRQRAATLFPINPKHPDRYRYESYKEAWPLLTDRQPR
jgi:hypothetical protein